VALTAFLFACRPGRGASRKGVYRHTGYRSPSNRNGSIRNGVSQMLIASLLAFAVLVISWMFLPESSVKKERAEAPIIGVRALAAEA
jgi:hypothetical protein